MGSFRLRRSVKLGPGVKLNLTKTGLGLTFGGRGAHYSVHSSGRRTTSFGIPGTGVYYQNRTSASQRSSGSGSGARYRQVVVPQRPLTPSDVVPKPGLFAGAAEKRYHDGVLRFLAGDMAGSLTAFEACLAAQPDVPSADLFAYVAGEKTERPIAERIAHLEAVVQGHQSMPDALQARYLPGGFLSLDLRVQVTPTVQVHAPFDPSGAALMLSEDYQHEGRLEEAIGLVHQLHELRPGDPAIRLAFADLLLADNDADGVLEATSTAENDSDIGVALLQYRAAALVMTGHPDAAIAALTDALSKTSGRDPDLLKAVRYDRALALAEVGKKARAKADLERILASDPSYEDVRERLAALA